MSPKTRRRNRLALVDSADSRPSERAWVFLLGLAALVVVSWGLLGRSPVWIGCGTIMAGLLVLSRLIVDMRSGVTASNWGMWRRDENWLPFRANVCFWGIMAIALFAVGILVILGIVSAPPRIFSR